MRIGFNYPVSKNLFGSDIGPFIHVEPAVWDHNNQLEADGKLDPTKGGVPLPPLFDNVDRNLRNLKNMGVQVVRWFLLGNGTNYGPAPTATTGFIPGPIPGGGITYSKFAFSPPTTLDKRFTRDFEELLKRFAENNERSPQKKIQILPSLIDFYFGSDAPPDPSQSPPPNGTGANGRADVIRDPASRKIFLDKVLDAFLEISKNYRDQIFAWEVINEPFWLCRQYGALGPKWPGHRPEVTDEQMHDFLEDATGRIKSADFPSTVGHRYFDDLDRWPTGCLPQFHYYAEHDWRASIAPGYSNDPQQIRGGGLFDRNPKPILGEFDSSANRFGDPWARDLGNTDTTLTRLQLLESQGCETALIWPNYSGAKPGRVAPEILAQELEAVTAHDVIKLLPETRSYIAQYTGGTPPPNGE